MSRTAVREEMPPPGRPAAPGPEDRAWFEALFRARYAGLCAYASRLVGSPELAEDLVQDLFVAIWNRPDPWRARRDAVVPLLYTAVRNRAFNALKRRRLEERSRVHLVPEPFAPGRADDALRHDEVERAIHLAVRALPEQCRLIFCLNRNDGLTYAQIARTLQISVKTVETQMGRALKALRSRLAVHLAAAVALLLGSAAALLARLGG